MKMQDLGMKHKDTGMPEKDKDKIHYPSFSVDKDMKMKKGQKVMMEGVVSGYRDDSYGQSTIFEVHKCGVIGKMTDEEFEKLSDAEQRKELEKGR